MTETLPPHFLDLVANALLHSFWRKKALRAFLRRMGIKDVFIDSWHADETKRDFIYRMFPSLEASEKGREALRRMARSLHRHPISERGDLKIRVPGLGSLPSHSL
jgi:hypothetical protein